MFAKVKWTNIGEWAHPSQAVMKTLTDITIYTDYVAKLNALVDDADTEQEDIAFPEYIPWRNFWRKYIWMLTAMTHWWNLSV